MLVREEGGGPGEREIEKERKKQARYGRKERVEGKDSGRLIGRRKGGEEGKGKRETEEGEIVGERHRQAEYLFERLIPLLELVNLFERHFELALVNRRKLVHIRTKWLFSFLLHHGGGVLYTVDKRLVLDVPSSVCVLERVEGLLEVGVGR